MERSSKSRESVQRRVMKHMIPNKMSKAPGHRACIRAAALAIANVTLDRSVPLKIIQQDLEDFREAIDNVINLVSMGQKADQLN